MRRPLLLAAILLALTACQPTANDTPDVSAPPVATAEEAAPTEAGVEAAISERAAGDFARRPLDRPLPDGVEIPFAYHRLFENRKAGDTGSEYRALLEVFGTTEQAELALDAEFTDRGFTVGEKSDDGGKRTLVYQRTYGPTVTVQLAPYAAGTASKAPGATGTLHLTWISPE